MAYNNPIIKVEWEDIPENFTVERIKRVKRYFQDKYNAYTVKVITKNLSSDSSTKLKSLEVSDNILDPEYQKKLMKDFMSENNIAIKWDLINRLDDKVNGQTDKITQNKVRYNKWYINKIEFSNFLSFGEDNIINFSDLDGITVVESNPKNFGGKTISTIDLLMFLFFNMTTKTKTNIEIFNRYSNSNEVKVRGYVSIDDEDYIISRVITRKMGRDGEYSTKSDLEFSKIEKDGTVVNLSGEQRRETESFITSTIGRQEDFLSTILTTGKNLEDLIDSKPTARGLTFSRFLGIENLLNKGDICKEMYNDWNRKLVSNTYNLVDLESDNKRNNEIIIDLKDGIIKYKERLSITEEKLKGLREKRDALLSSRNNDIDQDLIKMNPERIEKEIQDLKNQKGVCVEKSNNVNVKEPSIYYLEDEHEKIKDNIILIKTDIHRLTTTISEKQKLIDQFVNGTFCPTCKRPFDDVNHDDEINDIKKEINEVSSSIDKMNQDLNNLVENEKQYNGIKKEYDEYEKNKLIKSKLDLESEQKQLEIDQKQSKLDKFNSNKKKLEENQKIDIESITLKSQIDTLDGEIKLTNGDILRFESKVKESENKIETNNTLIKKIKSEEEVTVVFKAYLSIFGKNGIAKVIMKNMIPLINQELSRILSDSCYFILELNINDKNEIEFLLIDTETRVVKPLTSGSGYEKTISSLALRSVLTKISSLPKPNIVVMDEVFGKVADENLELVGEFFKKIKNYFDRIFVISHNPLIRNWSDNIIMIKKEENISSIDYVTTKIS